LSRCAGSKKINDAIHLLPFSRPPVTDHAKVRGGSVLPIR